MTRRSPVKRSTIKDIMQRKNKQRILARQKRSRTENVEILKTRRRRWYEIDKERLVNSKRAYCQQNKEHIRNYRRQHRKNNRERTNEYWRCYYAKNKEQINQILHNQRQRKIEAGTKSLRNQKHFPQWRPDLQLNHAGLLRDFVEETVFKNFSILTTLLHPLSCLLLTIHHEAVLFSS